MKKILLSLMALLAILPASADRYLTFGVNDTIRIKPSRVPGLHDEMVRAHFDGRANLWNMTLLLPTGMTLWGAYMRNDMLYIPYINYSGEPDTCSAQLSHFSDINNQKDSLSASIIVPGYEPNGHGGYDYYGAVKWEAGDYNQMCALFFELDVNFPDTASIYINEHLSSTFDQRGFTIPDTYISNKRIFVYIGYMRGDVDGNEIINIADVTELTDYILTQQGLDKYQLEAADFNGDGMVDIADVAALSDYINIYDLNSFEDPSM